MYGFWRTEDDRRLAAAKVKIVLGEKSLKGIRDVGGFALVGLGFSQAALATSATKAVRSRRMSWWLSARIEASESK